MHSEGVWHIQYVMKGTISLFWMPLVPWIESYRRKLKASCWRCGKSEIWSPTFSPPLYSCQILAELHCDPPFTFDAIFKLCLNMVIFRCHTCIQHPHIYDKGHAWQLVYVLYSGINICQPLSVSWSVGLSGHQLYNRAGFKTSFRIVFHSIDHFTDVKTL